MNWGGIDKLCDNYALFLAWQWRLLGWDNRGQMAAASQRMGLG